MIAVKLLGGALLMAVGVLAAFTAVGRERRRLAVLDAWIDLIDFIKGEIDLYLTPLCEILARADPAVLSNLCDRQEKKLSLQSLFSCSAPFLDEDCKRELSALIRELGSSYREEQIKQCEHHVAALRRTRDRLFAELPQKTKLYTTLSVCASAGALILLW